MVRLVALIVAAACVFAQTLEFDAASVKPAPIPADRRFAVGSRFDPGRYTGEFVTLRQCIGDAYGVRAGDKIVGPAWLESERYNITAKAAGPVSAADLRVMLQHLLATRFKLKLHTEQRPTPIYALVTAGKGLKLSPVPFEGPDPNAGSIHPIGTGVEFAHASMKMVAQYLSGMGRRVVDETGAAGLYSFNLTFATKNWSPDIDPPADSSEPSVFAALQSIGLKLENRQGEMLVYVVDEAERVPIEN